MSYYFLLGLILINRSIQYLNENPYILLLDCTYKTNKFGMLLLDILGVDGLDQGFTIGVAFLNAETEGDYNWAISHLRSLFQPSIWPSVIVTDCDEALMHAVESKFPLARTKMLLCFWHAAMNVVTNCKKFFETEEAWEPFIKGFRDCVYAKTEEEFEDIVNEWKAEFFWNDGNPWETSINATPAEVQRVIEQDMAREALAYCLGRWLGTYKKYLVHCYVDQVFHASTTTTSRLEGAHYVLKCWIGKPTKNLTQVWESVSLAINHQLDEIAIKRAKQRSTILLRTTHEFFGALTNAITITAKVKAADQWQLIKTEPARLQANPIGSICTGNYWRSMGIPCWHMMKERLAEGGRLQPADFHPHWHWEKPLPGFEPIVLPTPILDPETRQRRRTQEAKRRLHDRQYTRARTAQTGRVLSQFEQQQAPLRHCSACIEFGHDKATCRGCRSSNHNRSACPHITYQRRVATDSVAQQLNIEELRRPASQPYRRLILDGVTTLGLSSQMDINFSQNLTQNEPLWTSQNAYIPSSQYPPPSPTQPQSHRWNGPDNALY
jgi:hypothetical protein